MVPVGTRVTVIDRPVKAGWSDGALYLEVHPTQDEADAVEADGRVVSPARLDAESVVRAKAGQTAGKIDWALVRQVARERRGLPVRVAR
jgi:L,D-transpeptidase ErfK/SrfK